MRQAELMIFSFWGISPYATRDRSTSPSPRGAERKSDSVRWSCVFDACSKQLAAPLGKSLMAGPARKELCRAEAQESGWMDAGRDVLLIMLSSTITPSGRRARTSCLARGIHLVILYSWDVVDRPVSGLFHEFSSSRTWHERRDAIYRPCFI